MKTSASLLSLALLFCLLGYACAQVLPSGSLLIVLFKDNQLLVTDGANPSVGQVYDYSASVTGKIRGIDVRPANGLLYAVTNKNQFWTLNYTNGNATLVSTMNTPFVGGNDYGFDFNPTVDRARLVGLNGANARYNVDTGALVDFDATTNGTQRDLSLNYPNSNTRPEVVAVAYTNSRAGATTTSLYDIDRNSKNLVLQNPPNNGTLTVVGSLGLPDSTQGVFRRGGFDIYTDPSTNASTAILGTNQKRFYRVNLATGAATRVYSDAPLLKLGRCLGLTIVPPSA